jgi:hypothetical protein
MAKNDSRGPFTNLRFFVWNMIYLLQYFLLQITAKKELIRTKSTAVRDEKLRILRTKSAGSAWVSDSKNEGFKMKKLIVLFLLLFGGFSSAINAGNTFDPATKVLTIGTLAVTGDQTYNNVVVRLDQFSVLSVGNTFDPATNVLTIDSLAVAGDRIYKNVVVHLDQFSILGVGIPAPSADGVSTVCGPEHITIDKYNLIQIGMTLDQVKQIIGCEPDEPTQLNDFAFYVWAEIIDAEAIAAISVTFDDASASVTNRLGIGFKMFAEN